MFIIFAAIEVLDIDITTVDVSVSLSSCYSMMFTEPILEANFEATSALILESYTAMSGIMPKIYLKACTSLGPLLTAHVNAKWSYMYIKLDTFMSS